MSAREWKKVLWTRQPFPDNYVPPSFLSSLTKNSNFHPYTYWSLVSASCAVTQHIATIFIFLAVFVRLKEGELDPRALVWLSVASFVTGYAVWEFLEFCYVDRHHRTTNRAKALKSSILVFLALMALSPVLKTLTAATSSDSIWALSASLFALNTLLADYGSSDYSDQVKEGLSSVLSLNAAMSASVVLASRLQDNASVFALVLFSVQIFALFPILRHRLQVIATRTFAITTACLSAMSIVLNVHVSSTVTYLLAAVLVFITFATPAILVWAQKHKNEIRGPWDVAVPKVS